MAVMFLLTACGGTSIEYKDVPVVVSPGAAEGGEDAKPGADAPKPADSPDAAASEDGGSVASPSGALPGQEASPEASPPIPAETPESGQAAPPSDGVPSGGVLSGGEDTGTAANGGQVPAPDSSASPSNSVPPDGGTEPAAGTSPDTGLPSTQPPLLSQKVEAAGLTFDAIGHSQLVLVAAGKTSADIYCYDRGEDGIWKLNESLGYIKGYSGRNGVNFDKYEGDGCSPGGLFGLGYAFGNSPKPETGLSWRDITKDTYWIDDPNSKYYNQWVENVDDADWTGGEHLSENVSSYAYAALIEYNTAPNTVAGKGSAIFLHIGSKPTSGCVTVTKETLLKMLKWLSEDKNPGMLIVG
jgi:L,D-peptidoglycan transpeptidase YkuD (ErfK/YbiS/YcfS/YnhG family)